MRSPSDDTVGVAADWAAFASVRKMTNHWDRPGWRLGRRAFYWYLSFRDSTPVHDVAAACQREIREPYFDLIPAADMHMTLERVAFADEISAERLSTLTASADLACRAVPPLDLTIGPLAGSTGALSFSVSPREAVTGLREILVTAIRAATESDDFPSSASFRPHVGIAYCNREVDARPIVDTVSNLRQLPTVDVRVRDVCLVELTRHERAYSWDVVHSTPLGTEL